MPFTASHPAAVLALTRWGLPGSALVMGSIAPDMPMFLPIPVVTHVAHTLPGVITVDLAIGLVGFVVWQALFGSALIAVAPTTVRARLAGRIPAGLQFHFGQWSRVALVVAALLIGALTHVVWDSLTHDWMWGPALIPWLASPHGPLMGWQWAQHASDVAGLTIVTGWAVAWWRTTPQRPVTAVLSRPHRVLAWLAILCTTAAGFVYWLLNDSVFLAITRGTGLGVVGLTAMAVSGSMLAAPAPPDNSLLFRPVAGFARQVCFRDRCARRDATAATPRRMSLLTPGDSQAAVGGGSASIHR